MTGRNGEREGHSVRVHTDCRPHGFAGSARSKNRYRVAAPAARQWRTEYCEPYKKRTQSRKIRLRIRGRHMGSLSSPSKSPKSLHTMSAFTVATTNWDRPSGDCVRQLAGVASRLDEVRHSGWIA